MIKPRRLKISPRSNILEEAGKCRIVCGAWSLATYRTRGTIKRKAKSLSTSEKYILRCFFRNNEFGIASILFFQMRGRETFFNPGKISSSRARFANDCAQCHDKSLNSRGALTPSFGTELRTRTTSRRGSATRSRASTASRTSPAPQTGRDRRTPAPRER